MSNTDSFIDEVTEEVRRDRLFQMARRYGWIAVVAVLAIVGGAAYSEWTKAQALAQAKAKGDAVLVALDAADAPARIAALTALTPQGDLKVLIELLSAGEIAASGDAAQRAEAGARLQALASDGALAQEWRDLAALRFLSVPGFLPDPAERRAGLQALAADGRIFAPMAREQLALLSLEDGDIPAARAAFEALAADQQAPTGLRSRASQMVEILGGAAAPQGN